MLRLSSLAESRDLSDLERLFNPFFLVFARECAGDIAGARTTAQQLLPQLETLSKKDPDSPPFATALSLIHAVLGEKDAAIKEAEHAITLLPSVKDKDCWSSIADRACCVDYRSIHWNRAAERLVMNGVVCVIMQALTKRCRSLLTY